MRQGMWLESDSGSCEGKEPPLVPGRYCRGSSSPTRGTRLRRGAFLDSLGVGRPTLPPVRPTSVQMNGSLLSESFIVF